MTPKAPAQRLRLYLVHLALLAYCLISVLPVLVVVMNSFKARRAIFAAPLQPPRPPPRASPATAP